MELFSTMVLAQGDFDGGGGGAAGGGVFLIVWFLLLILMIAGMWKTFTKAEKPGWAAIIPIYNIVVLCEIAGRPIWWVIVILLVPCANVILAILLYIDVAKSYGKGAGFGLGLAFLSPIFFPLLGFGDARYLGPAAAAGAGGTAE
jgi:hypothetical protein